MKILAGKFVSHCKEFAPAPGFYRLKNLKQKKIVLSNSITGIIKSAFINFKGDFFDAVYASDSFRNKAERFIEIIKQEGLEKEEVLYVGDMGVDSELAREVGCKSAIVFGSASWDTLSEIIKSKPDFIIARLDELERIVN
jgi:FMN phosphatase YigB (HAD superfamily)